MKKKKLDSYLSQNLFNSGWCLECLRVCSLFSQQPLGYPSGEKNKLSLSLVGGKYYLITHHYSCDLITLPDFVIIERSCPNKLSIYYNEQFALNDWAAWRLKIKGNTIAIDRIQFIKRSWILSFEVGSRGHIT